MATVSSVVRGSLFGASRLVLKARCIPKRRRRFILSKVSVFILYVFYKWLILLVVLIASYVVMLRHCQRLLLLLIAVQLIKVLFQYLNNDRIVVYTIAVCTSAGINHSLITYFTQHT